MGKIDFKNMTNDEINVQLKSLENEYESIKIKVLSLVEKLKELDKEFIDGKKELTNRSKGIF